MEPVLRCKMWVNKVAQVKTNDGATSYEEVSLSAVYANKEGDENAKWSKWTPSASFNIQIGNPDAFGKLASGHEYFVDFIPAPKKECCGKTKCCKEN